jgi:tRNA (guanine37-N1)-methyltransferase
MRIDVVTCLPSLFDGPFGHSIIKRAKEKKLVDIVIHDLYEYGVGKHNQIDDYAYGGEAGMVLMMEPIVSCLEKLQQTTRYDDIIYMSPDGEVLSQSMANGLSLQGNLLFLCGHYKGIDERIREHFVTREISIGSYVLSGGELAAAVVVDSIVRLLPGVLSDSSSALSDSFQDNLLAPPVYTRPADFRGMKVPEVLLSGHAANIVAWREEQAIKRTEERRPDLLEK